MKYLDEYRNSRYVNSLAAAIGKIATRSWNIMEICGGQTHAIARYRLESFLPDNIRLLHGPGCPVCVTPAEIIDKALQIASLPGVIFTTFGDMLRVPGSKDDLFRVKALKGDVRVVYSPLDAVMLAEENPDREVVFFAIGFETTLPVNLMALEEARRKQLANFSLLTSFFGVPPAIRAILADPECKVDAFLTAGHVCSITGNGPYHRLADEFRAPMVVTGFEPADILFGIYKAVLQLESGKHVVENAYTRAAPENGNPAAQALIGRYTGISGQEWRGIGFIPRSGFRLKPEFAAFDADKRYIFDTGPAPLSHTCCAGKIMRGLMQPPDCPHFGKTCNPSFPLGAPMVSSEGACAAYYRYR